MYPFVVGLRKPDQSSCPLGSASSLQVCKGFRWIRIHWKGASTAWHKFNGGILYRKFAICAEQFAKLFYKTGEWLLPTCTSGSLVVLIAILQGEITAMLMPNDPLVLDHIGFDGCSLGPCARLPAENAHKGLGYPPYPVWWSTSQLDLLDGLADRLQTWMTTGDEWHRDSIKVW